jgi:hypothetical protein
MVVLGVVSAIPLAPWGWLSYFQYLLEVVSATRLKTKGWLGHPHVAKGMVVATPIFFLF